jgi:hypothetical protein
VTTQLQLINIIIISTSIAGLDPPPSIIGTISDVRLWDVRNSVLDRHNLTRSFTFTTDAVKDLIKERGMYWCRFCDKGLFVPTECKVPHYLFDDVDVDLNMIFDEFL